MIPGGSTTRRGRRVRLVTEIVMRPSPLPSAATETRPWRFASRRLISGIFWSVFASAGRLVADGLSANASDWPFVSSAETCETKFDNKRRATHEANGVLVKMRIVLILSFV